VLKRYNESDLYALFIGHLADRMRDGTAFAGVWSPISPMKRGEIQVMQERLRAEGYAVGKVDGLGWICDADGNWPVAGKEWASKGLLSRC
jgi:hypothetical protein